MPNATQAGHEPMIAERTGLLLDPYFSATKIGFVGAHAMVLGCGILTRDARRYRNYFPRVPLVTP